MHIFGRYYYIYRQMHKIINVNLLRSVLLVLLGLLLINTLQLFNFYIVKSGDLDFFNPTHHLFSFIDALLALGSTLIAWQLSSKIKKLPIARVAAAFFIALIIFATLTSMAFSSIRTANGLYVDVNQLAGNIVVNFSITFLPVCGITLALLYVRYAQALVLEKKVLQAQLLSKNLEPHFLFNNLSILSSMLRKDRGTAEEFLDSLSDVYRYFLKHNASDQVSLQEEQAFVEQYINLLVNRFGEAYQVKINIQNSIGYVIPFVLHTCIENAIKHNSATRTQPLPITIERHDTCIYVHNPYRPQPNSASNGKGLSNISRRYELVFGQSIHTSITEGQFRVKIPVIN
jgi:two-component system, LytTR family, sensor kinase